MWRKPSREIAVVLDTNVFISGTFWPHTKSNEILRMWKSGAFRLIYSEDTLAELTRILNEFKISLSQKNIRKIVSEIRLRGTRVLQKGYIAISEDPDDNKFIEAAVEGNARYIVSQDKHLLRIGEYNGIEILTPENFLRKL